MCIMRIPMFVRETPKNELCVHMSEQCGICMCMCVCVCVCVCACVWVGGVVRWVGE